MDNSTRAGERLVDAVTVAAYLRVSRGYVYEHADELGCRRLGSGPRARLRFSLAEVDERHAGAPGLGHNTDTLEGEAANTLGSTDVPRPPLVARYEGSRGMSRGDAYRWGIPARAHAHARPVPTPSDALAGLGLLGGTSIRERSRACERSSRARAPRVAPP